MWDWKLELLLVSRLLFAAFLGWVVAYHREHRHKPGGVRTHMLVAEGAALFMVASELPMRDLDPAITAMVHLDASRVAAGIVTGIGFLGAGTILHSGTRVSGMAGAAGIWVTAALGLLVGAGHYVIPLAGAVIAFAISAWNHPSLESAELPTGQDDEPS